MKTYKKIPVGILGATGMVGQRFITLLQNNPWFEIKILAASPRSAGKTYENAISGRWMMSASIPENIRNMKVLDVEKDAKQIAQEVRIVFSAIDMTKESIKAIEEIYAGLGVAVISNNSAHRWTPDIPMIIPEINSEHLELIEIQRKNRGWDTGLIAVKPNCSIQSYVPALEPLRKFGLEKIIVSTYQAISGAGKDFQTWPEMIDNIIPFISGEEQKSENEPLKIWGTIEKGILENTSSPIISANCIRVPVLDGHMATVHVKLREKVNKEDIIAAWRNFKNPLESLNLPSSPKEFLQYSEAENRPQTRLDRDFGSGMGISIGRLREDIVLDWKFVSLSHNTIRGAAGGAILIAELLVSKGYISR
ncbi:aspartate-semialdehyde dehydrogenase [Candidatus Gracilibacteria bacterium]|nr:aspartate-semialdehyde dehydrogenase [Candidatus Gracilibacteria bacterium]